MKYACQTTDGRYFAVISDDDDSELDRKEAPSKFEAMTLRDTARNAGLISFDGTAAPVIPSGPTELKAPKEPGTQEPATPDENVAPAPPAEKPKRARKPKVKKDR